MHVKLRSSVNKRDSWWFKSIGGWCLIWFDALYLSYIFKELVERCFLRERNVTSAFSCGLVVGLIILTFICNQKKEEMYNYSLRYYGCCCCWVLVFFRSLHAKQHQPKERERKCNRNIVKWSAVPIMKALLTSSFKSYRHDRRYSRD